MLGLFDELKLDAAALALLGIYPGHEAPSVSVQAMSVLEPFSPDERVIIGGKAIELGANVQSIERTISALNYGSSTQSGEIFNIVGSAPKFPWAWLLGGAALVGVGGLAYRKYSKRRR